MINQSSLFAITVASVVMFLYLVASFEFHKKAVRSGTTKLLTHAIEKWNQLLRVLQERDGNVNSELTELRERIKKLEMEVKSLTPSTGPQATESGSDNS